MTSYLVCSQPTESHSISIYLVYEKGEHLENLLLLNFLKTIEISILFNLLHALIFFRALTVIFISDF